MSALFVACSSSDDDEEPSAPGDNFEWIKPSGDIELASVLAGENTYTEKSKISCVIDFGKEFNAAEIEGLVFKMKAGTPDEKCTLAFGFSQSATPDYDALATAKIVLSDVAKIADSDTELSSSAKETKISVKQEDFPVKEGAFRYIVLQNTSDNNWGWNRVLLSGVSVAIGTIAPSGEWIELTIMEKGELDQSHEFPNAVGTDKGSRLIDAGFSNPWFDNFIQEWKGLKLPTEPVTGLKVVMTVSGMKESSCSVTMTAQFIGSGEYTTGAKTVDKDGEYVFEKTGISETMTGAKESGWGGVNDALSNLNWYLKSDSAGWKSDVDGIQLSFKIYYMK